MKKPILVVAVAGLSLAACGSEASDGADVPDQTLPDASELAEDAAAQGVSALSLAFDRASESTSYRAEMAMGMTLSMAELGQSIDFEADPATPMAFIEVDADDEQYVRMDLAPMMTSMMGDAGNGMDITELLGGDLSMEAWQDGETLVMDLGGFGSLVEQNAGAANPFPADVFTIDLDRLATGVGGADVASSLSGQSAPDPIEMAGVLREALGDSATVEADGERFSGTLDFLEYSRAFGQDPDDMLGGMDASFEQMGLDADAFAQIFDDITADVEVTLDDGAVDTVRFDVDLSPIFGGLMDVIGDDPTMTEAETAEMRSMFENMTFEMTMLIDYELDATVDVEIPQGDFPDATDEFLSLYDGLGAN